MIGCHVVDKHTELQYARDGLTKGRSRMREDNERLAEALRDLLAAHAMRASCQAGMVERCKCVPCATTLAHEVLGPNVGANRRVTDSRAEGQNEMTACSPDSRVASG